jgi:hypothetical protein
MIQRREQNPHMSQVEFVRGRLGEFVPQGEHLRDCGFIGHWKTMSAHFFDSAGIFGFKSRNAGVRRMLC